MILGNALMEHERLKARHRAERDRYPGNLSLRVHRALLWLNRAKQLAERNDVGGQFIYPWIAFNAAYATGIDEKYRKTSSRGPRRQDCRAQESYSGRQAVEYSGTAP